MDSLGVWDGTVLSAIFYGVGTVETVDIMALARSSSDILNGVLWRTTHLPVARLTGWTERTGFGWRSTGVSKRLAFLLFD